jgi:S1-C subfamily serine protease
MFRNIAISLSLLFSTLSLVLISNMKNKNSDEKIVYNAKNHVKKIMSITGGHCSSVFVNYDNKIRHITNAHCCTMPMIYNKKIVTFEKIDVNNDLCELKHDSMSITGITLSNKIPEVTDIIYAIGFPGSYGLTIGQGRIVTRAIPSTISNQYIIRTSAFTIGGSSGGAALNANGDLIGLMSQGNQLLHGSFVPLYVIKQFLSK